MFTHVWSIERPKWLLSKKKTKAHLTEGMQPDLLGLESYTANSAQTKNIVYVFQDNTVNLSERLTLV